MEITQVNDLNLDLALFYARHGLGTRLFFLDWIDREPFLFPRYLTPFPSSLSLALPHIPPKTSTTCLISEKQYRFSSE